MLTNTFINCTGDACTGDVIRFTESVFGGSFRKPRFLGERLVVAKILKDSYGIQKQQHTFTIEVISSEGYEPLETGKKTTRKGRNIYKNGCERMMWDDENKRITALQEKHNRGDSARAMRKSRKECKCFEDGGWGMCENCLANSSF